MDVTTRVAGMHPQACVRHPLLFLEFWNAFPSLCDVFLRAVLQQCGMPAGLMAFVRATYMHAFAMVPISTPVNATYLFTPLLPPMPSFLKLGALNAIPELQETAVRCHVLLPSV